MNFTINSRQFISIINRRSHHHMDGKKAQTTDTEIINHQCLEAAEASTTTAQLSK
jgi:hypothetical protein